MGLFSKKKQAHSDRVIRIAIEEFTAEDLEFVRQFTSSRTFAKIQAMMDGYLVANIVSGRSDDFRIGWKTFETQLEQFKVSADDLEDSSEFTSMQQEFL